MKKLVLILFCLFSLFAQYEWSDPVQLSSTGIYSEIRYEYPVITVDHNGVLHTFWIKDIEYEYLTWYSQIEYRKSTDGGQTWSTTVNLTPEYNFYRIVEMQALCDSQNNVHLFYLRGSSSYEVLYKRFNGDSWSEPYEISPYATGKLRTGINKNDRIYLTWYLGTTYYTYCDIADTEPVWKAATKISNENISVYSFSVFDENNDLYSVGRSVNPQYPYFLKYDEQLNTWTLIKMFDSSASGEALVVSNDSCFYSNISTGPSNLVNTNYETFKTFNDSLWSDLNYINSNNDWNYRRLFIDKNDNLHLFEMHFGENTSLILSIKQNGIWNTSVIREERGFSYGNFYTAFNNIDTFYEIYQEIENSTLNTRIFFQKKQIDTSVESDPESLKNTFELFQNYPNPFNNETKIQFSLKKVSNVEISIFNSKGEFVQNLVSGKLNKGKYNFTFKADNINSGLYFYRLSLGDDVQAIKKMLYLK